MSKRERDRDVYMDIYQTVVMDQKGRCGVCKQAPIIQLAHRIPQSKAMIRKYGKAVIHHRRNLVGVCCLACNDKASISNHPVAIAKLVAAITDELRGNIPVEE